MAPLTADWKDWSQIPIPYRYLSPLPNGKLNPDPRSNPREIVLTDAYKDSDVVVVHYKGDRGGSQSITQSLYSANFPPVGPARFGRYKALFLKKVKEYMNIPPPSVVNSRFLCLADVKIVARAAAWVHVYIMLTRAGNTPQTVTAMTPPHVLHPRTHPHHLHHQSTRPRLHRRLRRCDNDLRRAHPRRAACELVQRDAKGNASPT